MNTERPSQKSTTVRASGQRAPKARQHLSGAHWLVRRCPWLGTRLLAELFVTPRTRLAPLASLPGVAQREIVAGKRRVRVHLIGEGPLVLLVHGWQGAASQLCTLALGLRDAGFRVALFDMPGHGAAPGWSTHGREFIEIIERVAAALGPIHALIGHSLGATASLMASVRGLPVAGVVALAPMPSFEFALRGYARSFGLSPRLKETLARRLEARIGLTREEFDLARVAIEPPVLLVHDLLDRAVPSRHSRALRDAWQGTTLFETIGYGHNRGLQAKHVSRAIVAFLLSLPGDQFDEVSGVVERGAELHAPDTPRAEGSS